MSTPGSNQHSPGSGAKPPGGRQRVISSCLTCRRRKVRCDHVHPICGACTRGNHVCTYAADGGTVSGTGSTVTRISKSTVTGNGKARGGDVSARLERLEQLLERAVNNTGTSKNPRSGRRGTESDAKSDLDERSPNSQTSQQGISDNQNGTLILDGEQTQFVSSLHYALLADEIQDIKALLGDQEEERHESEMKKHLVQMLCLGRHRVGQTLEQLLPETQEHRDELLEIFISNVNPMIHITHRPTLRRKFPTYIQETHPMAFAVFYAAINALPPAIVESRYGGSKDDLLSNFELGIEVGLAKQYFLTTSSLEVFQAFLIWLTCIAREEDMGKAWTLLGVAIRIALNQGLHRDPSLFPAGSWDAITIEMRRRTWHQVCQLEFRAAECKGQEPGISEEDYTTLLPRNIDDEDLVENETTPTPYDQEKFTSVTFQLVRFMSLRALRRIVKSTYRLERKMMESALRGASAPDPTQELQRIYADIQTMVNELHEEKYRKYLRFCNRDNGLQRLVLGLSSLMEWRCYLLFWLRMPRAYRDVVFSSEVRRSIFEKSVNYLETLNGATVDVDAARFQWYIGAHSAFQAIMHILSELRNPLFDAPDRPRALRALQLARVLRETNHSKAWQVVRSMIERVISENTLPRKSNSDSSGSFASLQQQMTNLPTTFASTPVYAQQNASPFTAQESLPQMVQPQQGPGIPLQGMQSDHSFNWDDMNFNMIMGTNDTELGAELPEFDFGFWGDPVNFGADQMMSYPTGSGFYSPWAPT